MLYVQRKGSARTAMLTHDPFEIRFSRLSSTVGKARVPAPLRFALKHDDLVSPGEKNKSDFQNKIQTHKRSKRTLIY